jgi:hypothetical protein
MDTKNKKAKILKFKPVDDQANIRSITGQDNVMQWDAQEQTYRVIPEHPLLHELKDEFTQVILQLEESDDGFGATEEPDYINKGWIEALRFAITIINTKMKEEE